MYEDKSEIGFVIPSIHRVSRVPKKAQELLNPNDPSSTFESRKIAISWMERMAC